MTRLRAELDECVRIVLGWPLGEPPRPELPKPAKIETPGEREEREARAAYCYGDISASELYRIIKRIHQFDNLEPWA